jgi:hypothetical protein
MRVPGLHTVETVAWRALITRAQADTRIAFGPEVETYLIRMLLGYFERPDDLHSADPALLVECLFDAGGGDAQDLRTIGDQCLLLTGLLPEQAVQRQLPLSYFVRVGQNAYQEYAQQSGESLFARLRSEFVAIMDVLQTVREAGSGLRCLDPLSAYQLWSETGSRRAFQVLLGATRGLPVAGGTTCLH